MKTSIPPNNPFIIFHSFLHTIKNNTSSTKQNKISTQPSTTNGTSTTTTKTSTPLNGHQKRDILRVADTLFESSILESSLCILEQQHHNVLSSLEDNTNIILPSVRKIISSEYNRTMYLVRGSSSGLYPSSSTTLTPSYSMYSQISTTTTTEACTTNPNYYTCLLNLNNKKQQHYCNCRSFFERMKDTDHSSSISRGTTHYCKHILAIYLAQAFQCSSYQEEVVNEEEFVNIYMECVN